MSDSLMDSCLECESRLQCREELRRKYRDPTPDDYCGVPGAGAALAGGGAEVSQGIAGRIFARSSTASATAMMTDHQSSEIPMRVARTLSSVSESNDSEGMSKGLGLGGRVRG